MKNFLTTIVGLLLATLFGAFINDMIPEGTFRKSYTAEVYEGVWFPIPEAILEEKFEIFQERRGGSFMPSITDNPDHNFLNELTDRQLTNHLALRLVNNGRDTVENASIRFGDPVYGVLYHDGQQQTFDTSSEPVVIPALHPNQVITIIAWSDGLWSFSDYGGRNFDILSNSGKPRYVYITGEFRNPISRFINYNLGIFLILLVILIIFIFLIIAGASTLQEEIKKLLSDESYYLDEKEKHDKQAHGSHQT